MLPGKSEATDQATNIPQIELKQFKVSNYSGKDTPDSTCSAALMRMVKIYFKQEKGLKLHVDTGVCLVFLLHYPDSSFQHNAFQN